eukprot:2062054-Prymnesium_polylepis.1
MAGSSTAPTGIDRSMNPEQLGSLALRSACTGERPLCGVVWPARSRLTRCGCGDRSAGALQERSERCHVRCRGHTVTHPSCELCRTVAVPGDCATLCKTTGKYDESYLCHVVSE